MIFYLFLCNTLFFPLIVCATTTTAIKSDIIKDVNNTSLNPVEDRISNETKVQLLDEGGPILPDTLLLALPKGNHTIPNLGNDMGKNKVVARKGVVYENATKSQEKPLLASGKSSTVAPSTSGVKLNTSNNEHLNNTTNDIKVLKGKTTLINNVTNTPKAENKTKVIKKPLILSSDALENDALKSSPVTMVNNQIQSPNKEVKSYMASANKHPGMVMPIVITILLVPMFAVLGYMALRRGQEAWKNRHYKRMDFLLDGMYND